ncbi:MAG: molecular chaperone HtpG [Fibrobacterales bacterium]
MTTAAPEKMEFQTEVKQLLNLMIHSLYSHKEIFLRELISNSSDALDKVRFESLTNKDLLGEDSDLKISISLDEEKNIITIADNGIGMNHDDLIANLGTIARSGTKAFMENISGDDKKDMSLIGQFGVGFYSLFMVASHVEVLTKKTDEEKGWSWKSEGTGEFTIEEAERESRGTSLIIQLKEEEKEYVGTWKVKSLVTKYSEYVTHPIELTYLETVPADEEKKVEETTEIKKEILNAKPALWRRPKKEVTQEQYDEFYQHVSNDYNKPLTQSHNKVEGTLEYASLLFVPGKAPFDLYNQDSKTGLKLYVKRIFIMDECKELVPPYLRFIKGIIDSEDLPLNVSREILQSNKVVDNIKKHVTTKSLAMLKDLAENKPEEYLTFWKEMGNVLKEGFYMNFENLDELKALLRFQSTDGSSEKDYTSITEYVKRMRETQEDIYYITGESRNAVESSPHLEMFKDKGIEVLYLVDPIDEWVTQSLSEFDGKKLKNITKGDIDLDDDETKEENKKAEKEAKSKLKGIIEAIQAKLDADIKEVRISKRLKDSPCCLIADENDMGANMERIMKMSGQELPKSKKIMEINPDHKIWQHVDTLFKADKKDATVNEWIEVMYDQALLAEGTELKSPGDFVKKMNALLSKTV